MEQSKKINSYYGITLESRVIDQNSNVLAVLLPGMGYTLDRSLMDYSKNLAVEKGYDVLPIEYGFQAVRKKIDKDNMKDVEVVINESYELLKLSLENRYEKVIFIGKSLGTVVQRMLEEKIRKENYDGEIINVYLTPIDKTCELGIKENSLVVCGTKDPMITSENREKLSHMSNINYIEVDGAGHSLAIKNDVMRSIEALKTVIYAEKEFI